MKTPTLVPQVVQVVRESLIPVLAKMCGSRGVETFLNNTDRSLAHSALEGTRQALEVVLTETEPGSPDARGGEGPKLQPYALHSALGGLNFARRVDRDADGQTQGELDLMQLWHGCTMSVREESAFLLAQGTAQEAREAMLMFRRSVPSESTIKRLVATDGTRMMQIWDVNVPRLVKEQLAPVLPRVDMASVSADGAMVPLRGTESRAPETSCTEPDDTAEQASARAYREARIITVSLYGKPDETRERLVTLHNEQGKPHGECVGFQRPRLATLLFGEMPGLDGPKGQRAGTALAQIVGAIHEACPDAAIKGTTDGGRWPEQTVDEVIGPENRNADFYHATEHLRVGSKAAFGESELGQAWYKRQRNALLTNDGAAEAIAAELHALAATKRRRKADKKTLEREAGYFEKRALHMNYAELLRNNMVIGSGLVEAGVKRLVTLRMKRTGATWSERGGNAIITLRSLRLSGLWDVAWQIHVENENASYASAS